MPNRPVERRAYMRTIKRSFIALTILFVAILGGFAWVINDVDRHNNQLEQLVVENENRINDIQASRVSSCQQTYEGIRGVVITFFTPPPEQRTPEEQTRVDAFNDLIDRYVKGCKAQTKPEGS